MQNPANNLASDLQYPKTEFNDSASSLYWYGPGASGMPLLQFLAFYQVLEFYFPIYSKAEALIENCKGAPERSHISWRSVTAGYPAGF